MKIGILGNTNNYLLLFAMSLRQLGQDVILVVTEKDLLHRPEGRYPEFKEKYPSWIIDASHLTEWDFMSLHPQLGALLDQVAGCDVFILNSYCVSLLPLLNRPGIAFLTGSDLSHYANFESIQARTQNWDSTYAAAPTGKMKIEQLTAFIQRQRDGIRCAVAVRYMPQGLIPADDNLLKELDVSASKRIFLAPAELELVESKPAPHNRPLRIFCATRLTWKGPIEPGRSTLDYKGSDIMIQGLGMFYRETSTKLDIRLVRKGLHVSELQEIIMQEGIADQVTWLDEMSLNQVWKEFEQCDIVFEQLANSALGMAGLDALATGRPVIGNARPEIFEHIVGEVSAMCQAKTPEEVCSQLKRLVFDKDERERVGVASRTYVEKYFNPRDAAEIIIQILKNALSDSNSQISHGTAHSFYLQRIDSIQQDLLHAQEELMKITPRSYILRKVFQGIVAFSSWVRKHLNIRNTTDTKGLL